MQKAEAPHILADLQGELRSRFAVDSVFLVGSVARDEATGSSDIDLLVEFSESVGLLHFVRLQHFLEEALGVDVDLTTEEALSRSVRDSLLEDAVRAA